MNNRKGGTPNKILLATDLTPACDRSLDRATQLAFEWNATLTLFHVVAASSLRPWGIEARVAHAETEMKDLVRESRKTLKQDVKSNIVVGDPASLVVKKTREGGYDLVVTGPAHGKVLREKLLGSTAARLMRQVPVPVLAVRRRKHGPYRDIGVGVDFSKHSRDAFDCAVALFPDAHYALVHAFSVLPNLGGRNADRSLDVIEAEELQHVIEEAKEKFSEFVCNSEEQDLETFIEQGMPVDVLAKHVDKHWPDLFVTGTHGDSGENDTVIGSVAESLLQTLPCDVLAVRPLV